MPEEFKVGDVVQLKSGGPLMTVTYADINPAAGAVDVTWFVEGENKVGTFPKECLFIPSPVPVITGQNADTSAFERFFTSRDN